MDRIKIENLRLRCMIGFSTHELKDKQDVVINMTAYTDIKNIGSTDDPNTTDFLNYRTLNKTIIKHVENSSYKTLESLTESIAKIAVQECGVMKIKVSVSKPNALRFTDNVCIQIKRTSNDYKN
eukprot:TRINITY_DN6027_c0_g1_i1.p1 TRINITY_DN6027_c0_g1~~TRINITY_DN6027_c0_g1_i1.p1  ORF type:complete len:124 (+),score=20.05 TRINITY_DN6027_c0_g1_i1:449-820(+)